MRGRPRETGGERRRRLTFAGLTLVAISALPLAVASGQGDDCGAGCEQYVDPFSQPDGRPAPNDSRRPTVRITGMPNSGCTTRSFRLSVDVRDQSTLRSARFLLNRDQILTTRKKRFRVGVPARNLRSGTYRVTVVAVDAGGRRGRASSRFRRC